MDVDVARTLGGMLILIFALVALAVLILRLVKRLKYGEPMTESRPHLR